MALELSLFNKSGKSAKKVSRGRMPTKRSINFMEVGKKTINWFIAVPGIIVIIVIAGVLSKFFVVDKIADLNKAESELSVSRRKVDDCYDKIESFGELTELYGHYTYSGMYTEELNRVDRIAVIDLIRNVILPEADVGTWSIKDNKLTLYLTDDSLQSINMLAQRLEEEDIVDYCAVMTASTDERAIYGGVTSDDPSTVTAQVTIYLVKPVEGGDN